MMKKICLIENRSELGAGTKGSSYAIDAIRQAAEIKNSKLLDRMTKRVVKTFNDTPGLRHSPFAKNINDILKVHQQICSLIAKTIVDQLQFPLVISGDHSSAAGTVAGIRKAYPYSKIGIVWIDAHADMHSPFTTPSGNVHGMPLASVMGWDNKENKINNPDQETIIQWEALKLTGGISPNIDPGNLVFIGVRDTEAAEDDLIKRNNIKNITVDEIRARSAKSMINEALSNQLLDCEKIYISFDVDGLDCDDASYGTGTPVKNGLMVEEVKDIISTLMATGKVCCLELVEVNPLLDNKGNRMAEIAFEVLEKAVSTFENPKILSMC